MIGLDLELKEKLKNIANSLEGFEEKVVLKESNDDDSYVGKTLYRSEHFLDDIKVTVDVFESIFSDAIWVYVKNLKTHSKTILTDPQIFINNSETIINHIKSL